jgi:hypothetical protein
MVTRLFMTALPFLLHYPLHLLTREVPNPAAMNM